MPFGFLPVKQEIEIRDFRNIRYKEFNRDFQYKEEAHNFWEMVHVDQGSMRILINVEEHILTKGQTVFHRPHERHAHMSEDNTAGCMIIVSFSCDSPLMESLSGRILTLQKASRKILALFLAEANNVVGEIGVPLSMRPPVDQSKIPVGSAQLMGCYWIEFLYSIIRCSNADNTTYLPNPDARKKSQAFFMDTVLDFIQANVNMQPSLSLLCETFSISRPYLYHMFNENVGTSLIDYWISLKMAEAKRLIRDGELNITQISERLGYNSIHHFSRMFKRFTGASPSAYKNSVGN